MDVEPFERSLQLMHPGILDAAFQLMALAHQKIYGTACLVPFCVENCVIATHFPLGATLTAHLKMLKRLE